jgi:hypothetical protein
VDDLDADRVWAAPFEIEVYDPLDVDDLWSPASQLE